MENVLQIDGYGVTKEFPPWPHQIEARNLIEELDGTGIWLDMGTGKTKVVIDFIRNNDYKKILVICPKKVIPVWDEEFDKHCAPPLPRICLLDQYSTIKKEIKLKRGLMQAEMTGQKFVAIANYDSIWREPLKSTIENAEFDVIVADEIHRIKSAKAKASRFLASIGPNIEKRIGLSGTPLPHSPLDAFGSYRFLDRSIFGMNFTKFRAQYAVMGGFGGYQIMSWQNDKQFKEKFQSISIRVKAEDVQTLPEALDQWIWGELSESARKIYDTLNTELIVDLGEVNVTAANVLAKLLRLQQITGGSVGTEKKTLEIIDWSKKEILKEIVEDLPINEPVVVFCRFRHDLKVVAQVAEELSWEFSEVSGRCDERTNWNQKGGLIAVQIDSGGEGVDFTKARIGVFYSTGWSLGKYIQARKRLYRYGQERNVIFYHLGMKKTIDVDIKRGIKKREDLVKFFMEIQHVG